MYQFELSSELPVGYARELEALVFFNPQQQMAGPGVVHAIEQFGTPHISVGRGQLRVTLGQRDVQSLFALFGSDETRELAGMVLYLRTDPSNIVVLHIAVTERFSSAGSDADAMLVMRLLQTVVDSARRLKGVRHITILYSHRARVVRIAPENRDLQAAR